METQPDRDAAGAAADARQWYVRRGQRIHGPYPSRQIGHFLLLGRVLPTDRVSLDGETWQPLVEIEELIPDEVRDLHSDNGWNRFVEARNRVDERGREALGRSTAERRRLDDEHHQLRLRDLWTVALGYRSDPGDQSVESDRPRPRRGADLLAAGVLLLTLLVVLGLLLAI